MASFLAHEAEAELAEIGKAEVETQTEEETNVAAAAEFKKAYEHALVEMSELQRSLDMYKQREEEQARRCGQVAEASVQTEAEAEADLDERAGSGRGRRVQKQPKKQRIGAAKRAPAATVVNFSAAEMPELNDSDAENALSAQLARCMTTATNTGILSLPAEEVEAEEEEAVSPKVEAPAGGRRRGARLRRRNARQNSSQTASSTVPPGRVKRSTNTAADEASTGQAVRRLAPLMESVSNNFLELDDAASNEEASITEPPLPPRRNLRPRRGV